jgi:hypothetical protein
MISDVGIEVIILAVIGIFLVSCVWRMGKKHDARHDSSSRLE